MQNIMASAIQHLRGARRAEDHAEQQTNDEGGIGVAAQHHREQHADDEHQRMSSHGDDHAVVSPLLFCSIVHDNRANVMPNGDKCHHSYKNGDSWHRVGRCLFGNMEA